MCGKGFPRLVVACLLLGICLLGCDAGQVLQELADATADQTARTDNSVQPAPVRDGDTVKIASFNIHNLSAISSVRSVRSCSHVRSQGFSTQRSTTTRLPSRTATQPRMDLGSRASSKYAVREDFLLRLSIPLHLRTAIAAQYSLQ